MKCIVYGLCVLSLLGCSLIPDFEKSFLNYSKQDTYTVSGTQFRSVPYIDRDDHFCFINADNELMQLNIAANTGNAVPELICSIDDFDNSMFGISGFSLNSTDYVLAAERYSTIVSSEDRIRTDWDDCLVLLNTDTLEKNVLENFEKSRYGITVIHSLKKGDEVYVSCKGGSSICLGRVTADPVSFEMLTTVPSAHTRISLGNIEEYLVMLAYGMGNDDQRIIRYNTETQQTDDFEISIGDRVIAAVITDNIIYSLYEEDGMKKIDYSTDIGNSWQPLCEFRMLFSSRTPIQLFADSKYLYFTSTMRNQYTGNNELYITAVAKTTGDVAYKRLTFDIDSETYSGVMFYENGLLVYYDDTRDSTIYITKMIE